MSSKWPARIALLVSVVMLGAIMTTWQALGVAGSPSAMQTASASASGGRASPSPSVSCAVPQVPQTCRTVSPSGSASPSGSTTASPSGGPGGGEDEKHDSTITIKRNAKGFGGVVKSVGKCRPKREVALRRVRPGADPVVGRDTTSSTGAWKIAVPNAKGRYYAKLLKRVFTEGDSQITCGGARSRTVRA